MIRSSAPECIPPSRIIVPLTQNFGSSISRAGAITKHQTALATRDGGRGSDVSVKDGYQLQKRNLGDRAASLPRTFNANPAPSTYCLTGTNYEWTQKSDQSMEHQWKRT